MKKQSEIFLESEGRCWHERNKDRLPPKYDPVMEIIQKAGILPNNVLEVGCGNGWRLDLLLDKYGCNTNGVDPSFKDSHNKYDISPIRRGTAADLPFRSDKFDLVIYGFCLYLVDREDLFKVVAEGDRVLQDGGYLVIHDFYGRVPYKRKYEHKDGLFSYHMDHHNLWLANPSYALLDSFAVNDDEAVVLLRKDIDHGWPLHE